MSDALPLTGRRVAVRGDDAAMRHARRLCAALGAEMFDDHYDVDVVVGPGDPASAASDWARSGAMALTGRADGPPLLAPGAPASALRGALVLFEALSAAWGSGVKELPGVQLLGERAAVSGLSRQGPHSVGGSYRPIRCADGWCGLSLTRPADVDLVPALVEADVDGDTWDAVCGWAASRTSSEVAARAQLLGLAGVRTGPGPGESRERAPFTFTPGGAARRRARPLVVDLTALWAGPLCAQLLGLAGARVIKVESVQRPDGARLGPAAFFDLLHAGHESVALDFATANGRRALEALVRSADVVLEASRPRALRQLGISADEVVATGTIWTSITAYGRAGETANHVGYGDDVAAAAGLVVCDGGVPMPCGDAIADPLAGVHAAVATAAALATDRSYLIDVSMYDVVAATLETTDPAPEPGVQVSPPTARTASSRAAALGEHTRIVLDELSVRG